MGFKRRAIGTIVILGAAAGGWYVWTQHNEAVEQAAAHRTQTVARVPVTVATVQRTDFPVQIEGLGTVQPYNTVTLRTRVDGQIENIYVKEGQLVKQGDLLLQIDPRPFQAALDEASAKEQQDEANLYNANLNFQRDAKLVTQNFTSQQQYDNDGSTVRQLTAQVASDKASVFNAQTQLSYTQIRAPISGRTSIRTVDIGNIVQAGSQAVMTIAQVQPIAVVFTAPEGELPRIYQAMQKGPVTVDALTADDSLTLASGRLSVINNTVDTATGTIELKADYANENNALWPGLSVDTRMLTETLKNVVVAPEDAVEHGPNGLYAYVIDKNDKAQVRTISTSDSNSGKVVISKGLAPGDRVVVAGQYRLQAGTLVAASTQPTTTTNVAEEQ
jgi:membrane fusion protein, multidrug efflux system